MFYNHELTITANTDQDNVVEETVKLTHGVITYVEVEFPPGCAGLVYCYIRRALHQVWPTNPEGKFRTDGRAIVWNDYYEMFEAPLELIVGGWNEDDTFPHAITFRFEITSKEIAERGKTTASVLTAVRTMLRI